MTKLALLEAFNDIKLMRAFEIEHPNEDGEYSIFDISANEEGVFCEGVSMIPWDECFSLDEHLESLYDGCVLVLIAEGN